MTSVFGTQIPNTKFSVERRGSFTIVGKGDFGGKAKDLIEKSDAVERAGFLLPHSAILQ